MIEIIGVNEGKEYEAALHIRTKILDLWPDISQSKNDHIKIYVGLKLYGYKIEDIDLAVIGHFSQPKNFDVEFKFYPRDSEPFVPRQASIKNFILIIEAKSHDPSGVKFEDKIAFVKYRRADRVIWEPVTEKTRQQMFEFKRYLSNQGVDKVYMQDLVFFTGLKEKDFPQRPHNCFGIDASFERILNILGQISSPRQKDRNAQISFGSDESFDVILSPKFPLLQTLEPTSIDRRRMDRIVKAGLPDAWLEDIGKRQIVIRGRGGVGKTVILLQMAYRSFDTQQMRSLVLTYNKALVADMKRTMALLGVPHNVERGGICIETVHSFVGKIMLGLGIIQTYDEFLKNYDENKDILLNYIRTKTIEKSDIEELINKNPDEFFWDTVFVDEGQDWPRDEIEILRSLYGMEKIIVADGVDQFVRSSAADWSIGIDKNKFKARRLTRCLRMKANLAYFVSDFAKALDLREWDLEANVEANGGRVIIVEGNLASKTNIYDQLRLEAAQLGNYPVDMLACVPPTMVKNNNNITSSMPGDAIISNGGKVWDASSLDVREHFPTDRDALRIVQYDSCRGLEGWTVINYGFDEFWNYKYSQWLSSPTELGELFETPEDLASFHASRWAMIPLTRAIDTLVINVSDKQSRIKNALQSVHKNRPDFIEWMKLD